MEVVFEDLYYYNGAHVCVEVISHRPALILQNLFPRKIKIYNKGNKLK